MFSDAVKIIQGSKIQGTGVTARRHITPGEIIYRFDNGTPLIRLHEIISWPESDRIEFLTYAIQFGKYEYIFREGNIEYVNHSCEPNAWWEDFGTLTAKNNIMTGEEVTYDYSTINIQLRYEMQCMCGSPSCRSIFTNKDYLKTDFQEKYGDHLPRFVLDAIHAAKYPDEHNERTKQLPEHVVESLKQAGLDAASIRRKYGGRLPQHVIDKIREIISSA